MKPIKIITDSCSDITSSLMKEHDIDCISFTIYFKGKEVSAEPWKDVHPTELYNSLREGEAAYTFPATEHEIKKHFKKYLNDYDILYVAACEKQSTTIVKARKIAHELIQENEGARIEIVDSLNASIGELMVVMKAVEYRDEGLSLDEIVEKVSAIRKKVIQFATVDSLTYLSMAKKINARTAAIGNMLKLKPILISDKDGRQTGMKNVRGRVASLNAIVDLFMENILDSEEQEIHIIHGEDAETAKIVRDELIERGLKCKRFRFYNVGPVVGITTGPGMVGLFGFGKEVTFVGE